MLRSAVPAAYQPWPPDDTEESVVGTDTHQMTILNLRLGTNEVAQSLARPGGPPPWHALSQTLLTGMPRRDGTRYRTLPDVFVYRTPIDPQRGSLSLRLDGPPVLIVEVASESTYESDLDLVEGKAWSYAQAGVQEYLVIDPTGLFIPELIRAWQLEDGAYRPWLPEEGRWHSRTIAVSFGVEDGVACVYGQDGSRQLQEGEISHAIEQRDEELERLRRRLARYEEP